jgi:predicted ATP-grasp superfamily ATP-dependent carboligase
VLARSEAVNTQLADCAVKILRALKWEGVAQLDFRHDPRTGEFALLEINGRFWGSTSVAVSAGLDLPYLAWQLAQGEVPPAAEKAYRVGRLVRWLEGDVRRMLDLWQRPEAGRKGVLLELIRFLADFRPGVHGMFWSWRDPWPGLDTIKHSGLAWFETRWKQVFSIEDASVEEIEDDAKAPLV